MSDDSVRLKLHIDLAFRAPDDVLAYHRWRWVVFFREVTGVQHHARISQRFRDLLEGTPDVANITHLNTAPLMT